MTDGKMTALDLLQAAGGKPVRQKAGKLRSLALTRQFEDLLTKAAVQPVTNDTAGVEAQQPSPLPAKAKAVRMDFASLGRQALTEAADQPKLVKPVDLLQEPERAEAEPGIDLAKESLEEPLPEKQEPPRSDAALARLTQLFGGAPPGQRTRDHEAAEPETTPAKTAIPSVASSAGEQSKPSPAPANQADGQWSLPQAEETIAPLAVRTESLAPRTNASPSAAQASQPAEAQKPVQVTVTRVETALMPAGLASGQPMQISTATREVQPATPAAPAPPAMPAASAVVRSMEFRLQPESLGDVRVSLHLRGDALRLSVEVSTTEAHALLQSDKRALRDVLEKAGFEIADTAVTITLRPEAMPAQPASAQGQDASTGQQRGSQGSGTYQPQADDQPRQGARHAFKEEAHDNSGFTGPREKVRPAAGGIYL